MCKPANNSNQIRRVVVAGAGPAGLLCASLLLARNKETDSSVTYQVTLIDGMQDFGALSKEELSKSFRSWMLGLANHGCDALRELPDLYDNYVKGEGVLLEEFNIYLGKKRITQSINDEQWKDSPQEAFIVDRNYIVAAIGRYVKELTRMMIILLQCTRLRACMLITTISRFWHGIRTLWKKNMCHMIY